MGKSDPIVFQRYANVLERNLDFQRVDSVALLGFSQSNDFTDWLPQNHQDFYDIQHKGISHWDINTFTSLRRKYDLIVCTRCPYFVKDPGDFVQRCLANLNDGGYLFVDWGLGDHWRFEDFKVGWVKDGEHEYAEYAGEKQYLYSCVWSEMLEDNPEVMSFRAWIEKKGYSKEPGALTEAIQKEVPNILPLESLSGNLIRCEPFALWPQDPQLYIPLLISKQPRS